MTGLWTNPSPQSATVEMIILYCGFSHAESGGEAIKNVSMGEIMLKGKGER